MKRLSHWDLDIWRISFLCNVVTAIAFQPFLLMDGPSPPWELWWQPTIVAGLYVLGQALTLTSLAHGEISVAAPVLGLKIVFVPIFLWLVGAGLLPASTWVACLGATLAVVLLNTTDKHAGRGRVGYSIVTASLGAAGFALFDVCVQMWSARWGHGVFLPLMFALSTLMSLSFVPLFHKGLRAIPAAAWPTLSTGAILLAIQAVGIVASVAFWRQVAVSNVVYSSRGLWSILFVWCAGRMLAVTDVGLTRRVLAFRAAGALLLLLSIAILVLT